MERELDRLFLNYGAGDTVAVGGFPDGVSAYGVYDMAGNVAEWVYDWFSEDFYQVTPFVDPVGPIEGTEKGIGSKTDQRLMRELRVHADVVINGAGTLRASGTSSRLGDPALEQLRVDRGKPPAPIAAVLSASALNGSVQQEIRFRRPPRSPR